MASKRKDVLENFRVRVETEREHLQKELGTTTLGGFDTLVSELEPEVLSYAQRVQQIEVNRDLTATGQKKALWKADTGFVSNVGKQIDERLGHLRKNREGQVARARAAAALKEPVDATERLLRFLQDAEIVRRVESHDALLHEVLYLEGTPEIRSAMERATPRIVVDEYGTPGYEPIVSPELLRKVEAERVAARSPEIAKTIREIDTMADAITGIRNGFIEDLREEGVAPGEADPIAEAARGEA